MKDYQKVILYIYPKIDRIVKDIEGIIWSQACSYYSYESAESVAENIAEYISLKNSLLTLKDGIKDILERFSFEELYLLEYKYFKRKKRLEGEFKDFSLDYNERTYFRKQIKILDKVNSELIREGFTLDWFLENFSNAKFIVNAFDNIKNNESGLTEKRSKKILVCKNTNARKKL